MATGGETAELRNVGLSTYAVIFLGTLNLGSPCAASGKLMANVLANILSINQKESTTNLVNILQPNSEFLQTQLAQYGAISSKFVNFFYYESLTTPLAKGAVRILVSVSSFIASYMS